jgi:hypothetical protein
MDCERGLPLPPRGCGVADPPCRGEPATHCHKAVTVNQSLRITLILKALHAKSSEYFCWTVALEFGYCAILFALEPRFW